MKLIDLYKIVKKASKHNGCILITKNDEYAEANIYGNCTVDDLEHYTKGFDNG